MIANLTRVSGEMHLALGVRGRIRRRQEAVHRHLGVDHHGRVAGQADDQVGGLPRAGVGRRRLFFEEVAALDHARQLDDAAELDFTPLAADVRRSQRARQPFGGGMQFLLSSDDRAQLRGDGAVAAFTCLVGVGQLCLHAPERFLHRRQQRRRAMHEVIAIVTERVLRQRRKRLTHLRLGQRPRRTLLVECALRGAELGAEPRRLRGQLALSPEKRHRDAGGAQKRAKDKKQHVAHCTGRCDRPGSGDGGVFHSFGGFGDRPRRRRGARIR